MLMLINNDALIKGRGLHLSLIRGGRGADLGERKGVSLAVVRTSKLTSWPRRNIDLNSA
jgi:hypothetical protein